MDQIKIFSPASVANVSCGFDVLGFCLDKIGDVMQVSKIDKPGVEIGEIKGYKLPKDPLKNVASVAVQAMLDDHPVENGFKIIIEKVPIRKNNTKIGDRIFHKDIPEDFDIT